MGLGNDTRDGKLYVPASYDPAHPTPLIILTLGEANGDIVPNVVAFTPAFILPTTHRGKTSFFVSHGTSDQILPIDQASRRLVPELRSDGYTVDCHDFSGRHEVPPDVADLAMAWLARRCSADAVGR